ncbi:HAD family hydrolase [Treponema sp. Marseille-Q4523]|uniref:HAD family hydrolase n=1 Tax=Treponema sp. Marseille-Q4523 TaxID=2810610 RepID=UPI00195FD497|nr:HAD-IA family hydrolase [Treponema sp. Marseille-Q4523]MBM7022322.1 HAD-IA family hydrolase [Treponema sp. Marseille-Q4523]
MSGLYYKAVIFDMDGTILDTLDDLASSVNYALEANGLPKRTREEVRRFVGNGAVKLIRRAVPEGTEDDLFDKVFALYTSYYDVHCADATKPYDGITELLAILRSKGVKTAVVSNKPDEAVQILVETYFPHLFDAAVGTRDGIKTKPAPDSVFEIIKKIGAEKKDCVYVGDSEVDIETAKNAGIPCISVSWGFKESEFLAEHGAQKIVNNAKELSAAVGA